MIQKGQLPAEEYFAAEGFVNYSLIKRVVENGNLGFVERDTESLKLQRTFDLGDIIETYLLESTDLSYIKVDKTDNISGQSVELFTHLLLYCKEHNIKRIDEDSFSDEIMLDIIAELGLWKSTKRQDILLSNCNLAIKKANFYLSLEDNSVIADSSVFSLISDIEEGLTTFENVRQYYTPQEDEEWFNQYTILEDEFFEVPTKVRIDRLIINHKSKTIKIIDVKTTQNKIDQFLKAFYQFKYYYQLPYYTKIFKLTHPEYADYKVEMSFLVISKTTPKIPALYILPDHYIDIIWNGVGNRLRGIHQIMEEIKWYWDYGTSVPYEIVVNNNIMIINNLWSTTDE